MPKRTTVCLNQEQDAYILKHGKGIVGGSNQKVIRQSVNLHMLLNDKAALKLMFPQDHLKIAELLLKATSP